MNAPMVPLGEISMLVMGQAPAGKDCNKTGDGVPFVKAGEFSDRYPVIREWTTAPKKHAQKGDVLVCVVGATAGKINDGIDCAIGRSVASVRPKKETLDSGYLYRFLQSMMLELRVEAQGLAQGVITREMINRIEIPLPPLEEQKRIARILDQADALRRLRARALEKLNTLGQAIFHEMFGSDLRSENRIKLAELIEVRSSLDDPKLPDNATLPHVGPEHITSGSGFVDWQRVRTCAVDGVTSGKYVFQTGDVLYSKIRPYLNKVAMADRKGMCSADMYALHVPSGSISSRFLHFVLGSQDFLAYADTVSNRANIPKMNRKQLLDYATAMPSRAAQEAFEVALEKLDYEGIRLTQAQYASDQLFASLQAQAYSGVID